MQEVFPTEAMTLRSLPEDLLKMTDTVSRRLLISCCLAGFPMRRSFRALPGFCQSEIPSHHFVRDVYYEGTFQDIMNALQEECIHFIATIRSRMIFPFRMY